MPGPIPVRVMGALPDEPEDVLRHPARQARLTHRAMLACDKHDIDATEHCKHCRAPSWAIAAAHYRKQATT